MHELISCDDIAALCRDAAIANGYPADLANAAAEMVVWLERHGLPGMEALAIRLEKVRRFDLEAAQPQIMESGKVRFPEPILAGIFLHERFDEMTFPMGIEGPDHGALLIVPFLALSAHERDIALQIAFLGSAGNPAEAARLNYRSGQSALEGLRSTLLTSKFLGVEKPERLAVALIEAEGESVSASGEIVARLKALL
ncbi:MAG: DUF3726 domain-containing protein [Notoacmeibacter sp.]|nr:DUF3726 domain-containing protein [Notoacmeibacter sp.]